MLTNKTILLTVSASLLAFAAIAGTWPGVAAPAIGIGGGWSVFNFPVGPPPLVNNGGAFTYDSTGVGVTSVRATDVLCKGDVYEVFDSGVSLGTTTPVPSESPGCTGEGNPDVAFLDPGYSHGCFTVAAEGQHSITLTIIQKWQDASSDGGYIRVDAGPCPSGAVPEFGLSMPFITSLAALAVIPVRRLLARRKTDH